MNFGPLIFFGALLTMAVSWYGMVLGPVLQLGRQEVAVNATTGARYPLPSDGLAQQGREVYRSQGCNYCHSQQVRGAGVAQGTNFVGYAGSDIERGWGIRPSVARDFLNEQPVMLGRQRIGQDLRNIGARQTNAVWHFQHLYDPQTVSPGSVMPAYRYLFELRHIQGSQSPDAIAVDAKSIPPEHEVVPKLEARALVAYVLSLESQTVLYEAPLPIKKADEAAKPATTSAVGRAP